jgi:uncharacterized C2H2 Zn-finger protein
MTVRASCPDSCPFKADHTCYPEFSPLGFMWIALEHDGFYPGLPRRRITPINWDELCRKVGKLPRGQVWRHNTAGDLPGIGDAIDLTKLNQLVEANKGRRGFTYTHKPVGYQGQALVNAQAIYAANQNGFKINLSADDLQEADEFADMGIAPVVVVVPSDAPRKQLTPKGRKVIVCPAEFKDEDGEPIIQCDRCQLCAKDRKAIVAFRAHGKRYKKVDHKLKLRVIQ